MDQDPGRHGDWPPLPYAEWAGTCAALHLWTQILGKYRLARTPWLNHSWHATLYVSAPGFTTSMVPDQPGGVEILLDLIDHRVIGSTSGGNKASFDLAPMSVAEFHRRFIELLREIGAATDFHHRPNEIEGALPFAQDQAMRPYDA